MGKINWPLQDIRRDPLGIWHPVLISGESFVVPTTPVSGYPDYGFYTVSLTELPLRSGEESKPGPNIQCPIGVSLTPIEGSAPGINEVLVDYERGSLTFHSSKSALSGIVDYWAKGSIFEAAEPNDLNSRLVAIEGSGYTALIGTTGARGLRGITGGSGVPGLTGDLGQVGLRGSTGILGGAGSSGPSGAPGLTGLGGYGETGARGSLGGQGLRGLTGLSDIPGRQGLSGLLGIPGLRGDTALNLARYRSPSQSGIVWEIDHHLGSLPIIQTFDISGQGMEPTLIENGPVTSYVSFDVAKTGYAICIIGGLRGELGATGMGPRGETGIIRELHSEKINIGVPTSVWRESHNLGGRPFVQAYDTDGKALSPLSITSGTTGIQVDFSSPKTGYLLAVAGAARGTTGMSGTDSPALGFTFSLANQGSLLPIGTLKQLGVPSDATIQAVTVLAGSTGTLVLDFLRTDFEGYIQTDSDSITGGDYVTLTGGIKTRFTNFSNWNRELLTGDLLAVKIRGNSGIQQAMVILEAAPGLPVPASSSSSSSSSSSMSISSSSQSRSSISRGSVSSSSQSSFSSSFSYSWSSSSSSSSISNSSSSSFSFSNSSSSSSQINTSWRPIVKAYNPYLVSIWECDDNIGVSRILTDRKGGYNGTAYGGVIRQSGIEEYSIAFNGTDGYISVPVTNTYLGDKGTMSFWFKRNATGVDYGFFDKSYESGGPFQVSLVSDTFTAFFRMTSSTTLSVGSPGTQARTGWNHWAISWAKNGTVRSFLNGNKTSASTFTGFYDVVEDPITIGRLISTSPNFLNGSLDAIYYWNTDLSDAAIVTLFNEGHGVFYSSSSSSTSPSSSSLSQTSYALFDDVIKAYNASLVHVWRLNEPSGTVAYDQVGTANGLILGDPQMGVKGKAGNAISFDGVDDSIRIPYSQGLEVETNMTLSLWTKKTTTDSGLFKAIVDKAHGDPRWNGGYFLAYDDRRWLGSVNSLMVGIGTVPRGRLQSFDDYTYLMIQPSGPEGGGTFSDNSKYSATIGNTGGVINTAVQSKFGTYSAYFQPREDGRQVNLGWASGTTTTLGLNWTIDWWFRYIPTSGSAILFSTKGTGGNGYEIGISYNNYLTLQFFGTTQGTPLYTGSGYTIRPDIWYHGAVSHDGAWVRMFINGVQVLAFPFTVYVRSDDLMAIGNPRNYMAQYYGYLDQIRVSKTTRWNSAFTPPVRPYESGSFDRDEINIYTSDMVGAWNLDDERDSLGFLNLTNNGGAVFGTGLIDQCVNVEANKYLSTSRMPKLYITNQLTLSVWAKTSDWTTSQPLVSLAYNGGYGLFVRNEGSYWAYVYRNGSYARIPFTPVGWSNQWHHFLMTYDGRYTKLYVDGLLVGTNDAGGTYPISYSQVNSLQIGATPTTGEGGQGPYLTGSLDCCYLWKTVLSEDAINFLYNSGRGKSYLNTPAYDASSFNYCIYRVSEALKDEKWHHIAFYWADSIGIPRVFIDGSSVTLETFEKAGTTLLQKNMLPLTIAHFQEDPQWPQLYYKGVLDEIYLWNTTLSSTAINHLYYNGKGRFFSSSSSSSSSSTSLSSSTSAVSQSFSSSSSSTFTPNYDWHPFYPYDADLYAWHLDEASGTRYATIGGNNLTDSGGTGQGPGKHNFAASFSGAQKLEIYVDYDGGGYIDSCPVIIKGDFTLSLWFKPVASPSSDAIIIAKNDVADEYRFKCFWTTDNKLYFEEYDGNYPSSEWPLTPGVWHHLLLVGDLSTTTIDLYLDGVLKENVAWHTHDNQNAGLLVGGPDTDLTQWYSGLIDEIHYWTLKLPVDRLSDLYNYGYGRFYRASSSSSSVSASSTSHSSTSMSHSSSSSSSRSLSSSTSSISFSQSSSSFSKSSSSSSSAPNWGWNRDQFPIYDDSLLLAYTLEEEDGCHDLKSNNDGIFQGNVRRGRGKYVNSLIFDAMSNVTIPDFNPSASTGVIEVWLKLYSLDRPCSLLTLSGPSGNRFSLTFESDRRFYLFTGLDGSSNYAYYYTHVITDMSPSPLNRWIHLWIQHQGDSNDQFYWNGEGTSQIEWGPGGPRQSGWWHNCSKNGAYANVSMGSGLYGEIGGLTIWQSTYLVGKQNFFYNQGKGKFYKTVDQIYLPSEADYNFVLASKDQNNYETFTRARVSPGSGYSRSLAGTWSPQPDKALNKRLWIDFKKRKSLETVTAESDYVGFKQEGEYKLGEAFHLDSGEGGYLRLMDFYCHQVVVDPAQGLTDGLMLFYDFNEGTGTTCRDYSGQANTGTLYNTTDPWRMGRPGRGGSLYLTSSQYVLATGTMNLWQPLSFSVAFWIYPYTRTDSNNQIGANNSWGAFLFHTTSTGGIYCGVNSSSDPTGRFNNSDLPTDTLKTYQWQHFCFTYTNGFAKFFKNGELLASKRGMAAPVAWTGFRIGTGDGNSVNGLLEEVRVYNRALEESEVARLGNPRSDPLLKLEVRSGSVVGSGEVLAQAYRDSVPSVGWFSFSQFTVPQLIAEAGTKDLETGMKAAYRMDDTGSPIQDPIGGNKGQVSGDLSYGQDGIS